jgi:hypothetical protein
LHNAFNQVITSLRCCFLKMFAENDVNTTCV